MAATGTIVETLASHPARSFKKLILSFTTESGGTTVGEIPTTLFDGGEIVRIVYKPNDLPVGTDITLLDIDGKDVLLGLGADWGTTAKDIVPIMSDDGSNYYGFVFVLGPLFLTVAQGGDAKEGVLVIYWR